MPLDEYDFIMVYFSGGKDSVACVLHLLDLGVPAERIILHHHLIDGHPDDPHPLGLYYDWEVTTAYCRRFAHDRGMRLIWSWREGGIERQMMKDPASSNCGIPADILFTEEGWDEIVRIPTTKAKPAKRLMFPAQDARLTKRWCSAEVKIDVADKVIGYHPDFKKNVTILECTGERREESANRACYPEREPGRKDAQARAKRRVDQWRPVIDWSEQDVWDAMERYRVRPHPAYMLGFGRCSCMTCVFCGPRQWATIAAISPQTVDAFANAEEVIKHTMHSGTTIPETVEKGIKKFGANGTMPQGFPQALINAWMNGEYNQSTIVSPDEPWIPPAGAYSGAEGGAS
jgi:3'-phosphoadenosine 5'-phosphosulfate sulfotransferase (PAPS reductase)/FAD synthetase